MNQLLVYTYHCTYSRPSANLWYDSSKVATARTAAITTRRAIANCMDPNQSNTWRAAPAAGT